MFQNCSLSLMLSYKVPHSLKPVSFLLCSKLKGDGSLTDQSKKMFQQLGI